MYIRSAGGAPAGVFRAGIARSQAAVVAREKERAAAAGWDQEMAALALPDRISEYNSPPNQRITTVVIRADGRPIQARLPMSMQGL